MSDTHSESSTGPNTMRQRAISWGQCRPGSVDASNLDVSEQSEPDYGDVDESGDEMDDKASVRSRDGSEYEFYYHLKEQREMRKEELALIEWDGGLTEKGYQQRFDGRMEARVKAAMEEDKLGSKKGLHLWWGVCYHLCSADHIDHAWDSSTEMDKIITLPDPTYNEDIHGPLIAPLDTTKLNGFFRIHDTDVFTFTSLKPPEHSGPDWITVKSDDGAHEIRFRFIDDFHLILEASRDLVFKGAKVDASGPDTFVFMGIESEYFEANGLEEYFYDIDLLNDIAPWSDSEYD
ncbi:hypothetical protein LCI18_008757 [Fusarium solani-melongenae]|uniref:Uncharacterized protein n=1 Tax=Fusarium solani subsp. cucurbitae TaxID=2747967 RepID=A0ACD3Z9Q6_FUSSC|nr:hypothetical protein LCI18_008757 [Fusarium solani-melongenae]